MSLKRRFISLSNHGFTVVEAVVGISMTVILLMIIMTFMANYFRQNTINTTKANLLADSQRTLDTIGEDVRLSASADDRNRWRDPHAPDAPGDQLSWESDDGSLVLSTAAEDDEGNIIFADAAQYISEKNNNIYFVRDNKLYRRTIASPVAGNKAQTTCPASAASSSCPADRLLAEDVAEFSIRYLSGVELEVPPTEARSVELGLTLTKQQFGEDITAQYTSRMVFRND